MLFAFSALHTLNNHVTLKGSERRDRIMKRTLALLLALLVALSVSAFAEGELSAYSQAIDLSVDYPVFTQDDITFPLVDEPITVSVMFPRNANHAEDFNQIWWTQHVAELTGITFDFNLVEESVWEERKNLAFMSGEYPEVFFHGITATDELTYGYEGKLLDLKPLIKEYAPNIVALYEAFPDVVKGTTQENGAIYVLPMISYAPRSSNPSCILINSEWLEAVDMEVPTTTEELYEVLKAFKEKDPNGNGEADEIPTTLRATSDAGDPINDYILYAFGYTDMTDDIVDGQYIFVPAQDNYRAYVAFMNRLYTEGLLDMDYFTQDNTEMEAKLAAESVGVTTNGVTALIEDYKKYIAVPALTSPENTEAVWPMTSINYQRNVACMALTDKCSDEVAIAMIKFANYLVTTEASLAARLGPSQEESVDGYGYTYDYIENKHAYGATRTYPEEYSSYYNFRMSTTPMNLPAYINPLVDDVVVGSDDKNNWTTELWTASGNYGISRPTFDLQCNFTEEEQTDLAYYQEMISYATQARAKFITGEVELTDETWADYIANLESYGLEDYVAMCQTAYERYLTLPDTID